MTIRGLRQRVEIYSRRRWTSPQIQEIESAFQWSALLVIVMAVCIVLGGRG